MDKFVVNSLLIFAAAELINRYFRERLRKYLIFLRTGQDAD